MFVYFHFFATCDEDILYQFLLLHKKILTEPLTAKLFWKSILCGAVCTTFGMNLAFVFLKHIEENSSAAGRCFQVPTECDFLTLTECCLQTDPM